ncbi:Cyclic nucleotide-gated ion channel 4 [Orobanche hederae]
MPNYNEHGRLHNNDYDSSSHSSFSEIKEELDEEEEAEDEKENSRPEDCRSTRCGSRRRVRWLWGKVLDPKSKWVQEWNRIFLLVCAAGLFIDPLFFYALSVSENCLCLFVDGWFALTVTVLRCMTDALHLWNMWLQFKMNRRPPGGAATARGVAWKYFKSKKGFFFDLFVILPLPQDGNVGCDPGAVRKRIYDGGDDGTANNVFLPIFAENLPLRLPTPPPAISLRLYLRDRMVGHCPQHDCLFRGIPYAVGACWYLLGIQRAAKCLKEQCMITNGCNQRMTACQESIYFGTNDLIRQGTRFMWGENKNARSKCLENFDNFDYGAYKWTVQLVTNNNRLEKVLFPIFWGLMTLSTFGNLESTTDWLEVIFIIIVLTTGLLLVTMLIGNIKVFLHATTSKKQAMQLKMRNIEWWMRKRRLPMSFRQRVRNYERQRWAAMRGVDECEMTRNLPEGLRRDIKYHLCLDLVRQVPLFQHMDSLVLENICDRVKSLIFTKGETITREGDPVQRMLFIVRGHLQSSQVLRDGVKSCCMLGPGNFSGDELLSWCLRRPFVERLPPSSSTLTTLETTEAFGLEAEDVKYVTQHFRYTFVNEKVKRSARYYSPGWRTWAAVAIQLAWRRYRHRLTLTSLSFIRPRRPLSRCSSLREDRLRLYTALLTSPKPNQDDFDF